MLLCAVKMKYPCSLPRGEAGTPVRKPSQGTARLKPQTMSFSQTYQLWWKQGRALFPGYFPTTGKSFNTIFSADEIESLPGTSISGEKRPSFVCRGLEIGKVAQGRTLLFQLSAA